MKRQPTEWDKIFLNYMTNKWLISKIYKHLIKLNIKKKKKPDEKTGRRSKQTFFSKKTFRFPST